MDKISKLLMFCGLVIFFLGLLIMLYSKTGIGKLPGDIVIKKGKMAFYFPVITCIIISVIFTLGVQIFRWIWKK